jgi:hexulose-6-phosphate isomerase
LRSDVAQDRRPARRTVAAALAALALGPRDAAGQGGGRLVTGVCAGIFPPGMAYAQRCRQAKAAGFDAIEFPLGGELTLSSTPDEVKRLGEAASRAGVQVASLWVSPLASTPLNSPDPVVRQRGLDAIRVAIEFAGYLNCGALLVVPGRVGAGPRFEIGYETTWNRFSAELRRAVPVAGKAGVLLTLENVSNRFLVSPLEMRAFVDQFRSPWLQVHFDIGNVMYFGYPQDWILTLGSRIKRLHAKDRKVTPRAEQSRPSALLEGDVDWKAVIAALAQIDYRGPICAEIGHDPTDPAQLSKVSAAMDKILALA